ncbi:MAG: CaiB/BaiF CoA-transferase family protein [Fulvivirga sp.]|nr:CaiB/BaiF CoA-transferase family protein [Fulvivirga sp.]
MSNNILSGVKVIELASVLAGPSVGQFLAESGAEVIKVENPKTKGDVTRTWKTKDETTDDISAYFSSVNWGKKSIALDYSSLEGLKILQELIKGADIVITSFKPGDAKKLGVTYQSLQKINPGLIYGSLTGFGDDDSRAGYDAVVQAESGFMYINGEPSGNPLKLPVALMDILAAHHLKEAILLAYIQRLKSGIGQSVSVSLIDAAITSLANQATNWLVGNKEPERKGSLHPNIAPYGEIFKTSDNGQIMLAIGTDKQFQNLCEVLNISADEKFSSNQSRVVHRKALSEKISAAAAQWGTQELLKALHQRHVPAGLIRKVSEALKQYNKQIIAAKSLQGINNFAGFMEYSEKSSHFLPPPHFGEHTFEVLKQEIGLKASEIAKLGQLGVISPS